MISFLNPFAERRASPPWHLLGALGRGALFTDPHGRAKPFLLASPLIALRVGWGALDMGKRTGIIEPCTDLTERGVCRKMCFC